MYWYFETNQKLGVCGLRIVVKLRLTKINNKPNWYHGIEGSLLYCASVPLGRFSYAMPSQG